MYQVMIIMGSISDEEKVRPCMETLQALKISFKATVSSAHRTPERTEMLIKQADEEGVQVFICAAGMAAHLAGAVAARTLVPVIGIPLSGSSLAGMDALYSTVQMPPGFPVATMALDKAGAKNAAFLAAQILALNDTALRTRLLIARGKMREDVEAAAQKVEESY